ncbi:unnamed protein product [Dovyalis caffra]|uniref:Calcium-binding protein 39 n=1 Tax=Dovyalis caffra TaxID=77055 RepID=A0AAV1RD23_9ROSI|nr:unnamed protein product [Dovyalis caffra]
MSFSFFKVSRPKTPQEVVKAMKDSLVALDTKTVVEVKALEKALEEVEKNFVTLRCMLSGDGEVEPNMDQVSQLALEVCKEDVLALMIHKLPNLGWEARKDLVHCWSILLKQQVDSRYCSVEYIENHFEFLDFLVVCYDNKEIALNCGLMLRECIKFPTLAKYILESASFELFFKFVELPNFDVASDAFSTFKDLLTKHGTVVAEYLTAQYDEFFDQYEKLLTSPNYVTRRQSLKYYVDLASLGIPFGTSELSYNEALHSRSKVLESHDDFAEGNIDTVSILGFTAIAESPSRCKQLLQRIFVANPNKPREVKVILAKNHEKLLELLHDLSAGKGAEDEQFEEEKELIVKEIDKLSRLSKLDH